MFSRIQEYNSHKKVKLIASFFADKKESILDFGCGDLSFAKALKKQRQNLIITGIDVVDFNIREKSIKFVHYNGQELPFKNNTFDTVIAFHVLHHTDNAKKYFRELVRVAKRRILLVESVARTSFDFPGMRLMDWIFNVWKPEEIPLTYQFFLKKDWYKEFKRYNLTVNSETDAEISFIPKFFPTGRSILFELNK